MPNRRFLLLVACTASLIVGCSGSPDKDPGVTDSACQFNGKNEKSPGFPFDTNKFGTDVMPVLAKNCSAAGCHAPPTGQGTFTVWPSAKQGDCDFAKSFNSAITKVDLTNPANSRLTVKVTGTAVGHFVFPANAPEMTALNNFIGAAATAQAADGGTVVAPAGPSPFNNTVFKATIAPMFERCATSGCHLAPTGQGGFNLKAAAVSDADLGENFKAITGLASLTTPNSSQIYVQATTVHGSGTSRTIDGTQAQALLAWITDAKANAGSNPNPTCAPLEKFNLGTFTSEVLPILSGELDLNAADGRGRGAGCMSTACHGIDRGPGKLSLIGAPSAILQNFACFVNLASPSSSEILDCPTNTGGCRVDPHPGQDILGGANDLNYQRILAFLFGTKADVSPLDFAFFVRRINPIFDDVNSVEGGARGITCADASACHGTSVAGQAPPNGSDFPIITNASGLDRLTFNFVSATGFANFLNPTESSLFLYPTNEIANRAAHRLATGIDHPGGLCFDQNSDLAKSILIWAAGLRPDGNGFQRNWLVVGDFPATQITDQTIIDETTIEPAIFDRGGGSFNVGEWDGFFSDAANVDLNIPFQRAATGDRVAYAVSYAINTEPRNIDAVLTVTTNNPIRIYVDGHLAAQNAASGGGSAFMTLKAAGTKAPPTRILIKVLQRADDAQFAFSAQLTDQQGTLLTDATRELVFTLGKNGGI